MKTTDLTVFCSCGLLLSLADIKKSVMCSLEHLQAAAWVTDVDL
jgi:hypothetical protein